MIACLPGTRLRSGAKFEKYEPGTLNAGSAVPSPPITTARLPCSLRRTAIWFAFAATWNGVNTTSVSPAMRVTKLEKSVVEFVTESLCTVTFRRSRARSIVLASPTEYGS
jgi:hypothetical protein